MSTHRAYGHKINGSSLAIFHLSKYDDRMFISFSNGIDTSACKDTLQACVLHFAFLFVFRGVFLFLMKVISQRTSSLDSTKSQNFSSHETHLELVIKAKWYIVVIYLQICCQFCLVLLHSRSMTLQKLDSNSCK